MNSFSGEFIIFLILAMVLGFVIGWFLKPSQKQHSNAVETLNEGDSPDNHRAFGEHPPTAGGHRATAKLPEKPPEAFSAEAAPQEPATEVQSQPAGEKGTPDSKTGGKRSRKPASQPRKTAPAKDDLTRIRGIGPVLEKRLNQMDIARFDQIAAWTETDIKEVSAQLKGFQGRIARDGWAESARALLSVEKKS